MTSNLVSRRLWAPAVLSCLVLVTAACGNRSLEDLEGASGVAPVAAGVPQAAGTALASDGQTGVPQQGIATTPAVDTATGATGVAAGSTGAAAGPTGTATASAGQSGSPVARAAASGGAASAQAPAAGASGTGTRSSGPGEARPAAAGGPAAPDPATPGGGAAPVPEASGAAKTLLVGGLFHRTGPIPVCNRAFEGVTSYLSDLNERGRVGGHKFKLVAYDDGADATRNATLMKQLIERDGVAVVLECTDLTAPAGAEPVAKHKVPVIGGFGANAIFYEDPNWFPSGAFQQTMYPYHAMAYGKSAFKYTKVGLVYINVPQGQGGARYTRQYAPRLGMDVVYDSAFSPVEPDFTAYVVKLKQAGAQMVVFPGAQDHVIRFLKAAEQQGYEGKLIAPLTAYDPTIGPAVGGYTDGHLYTVVNHAPLELSDAAAVARYRNALKKYFPGVVPNTYSLDGWIYGEILEEAIKRLDGKDATRESLIASLRTFKDWQGSFNPPLTFVDGPQKALVNGCDSILAAKPDGSYVPDSPRFVCFGG
jgi:branched-chain amino acid transport system substrate-binding protein